MDSLIKANKELRKRYERYEKTEKPIAKPTEKPAEPLWKISREPYSCPLCKRPFTVSTVFSHFINDHYSPYDKVKDIHTNTRIYMRVPMAALTPGEVKLIDLFAYFGRKGDNKSSMSNLWVSNSLLPPKYEEMRNSLMIAVFGCKTSYGECMARSRSLPFFEDQAPPDDHHFYIFWLASPQTLKPIRAKLRFLNARMHQMQGKVVDVRQLQKTQVPNEFIPNSGNFIKLLKGNLAEYCDNGRLNIEIAIKGPSGM